MEWNRLSVLVPARDEFLQKELNQQTENEKLRGKFGALANKLGPWIDEKQRFVNHLSSGDNDSSLETQKTQLEQLAVELNENRNLAVEVDKCSQVTFALWCRVVWSMVYNLVWIILLPIPLLVVHL